MRELNVIGIDLGSLKSIIRDAVSIELQTIKNDSSNPSEEQIDVVLNRKEAADFLSICLTTLWKLGKSGQLKPRRINSKVYYLKSDLINFLNQAA